MQEIKPIVDEVRVVRDEIAKAHDYDIAKIAESVREHERKSGRTFVRLARRMPAFAKKSV